MVWWLCGQEREASASRVEDPQLFRERGEVAWLKGAREALRMREGLSHGGKKKSIWQGRGMGIPDSGGGQLRPSLGKCR